MTGVRRPPRYLGDLGPDYVPDYSCHMTLSSMVVSRDLQVLVQLQAPAVLLFQMIRQLGMDAYHLIALPAGLPELAFQAVDVPLAFPKQIRGSMNIQKSAQRRRALE